MKTPKQNRVTPTGALERSPAKGAWMGNRGILHNGQQEIISPWKHKAWVTCVTTPPPGFPIRKIFSPNHYSELFFLDEATALAAGHRPCALCRRDRYQLFKSSWLSANAPVQNPAPAISAIDQQLHTERALRGGIKVTYQDSFGALPSGCFISIDDHPYLIWDGQLHRWSHTSYQKANLALSSASMVTVLTPASIVATMRQGFRPQVHDSCAS